LGILSSVEFVDIDIALSSTSKEMATIGEPDLSATLNSNSLERFQTFLEDVHHPYSISETNNQMEARRVEGYTVGLVVEELTNLKLRRSGIVPDPNSLVDGAGGDEVFLHTDIHPLDGSAMEGEDEVFILGVVRWPLKVDVDLHDLVVLSSEDDAVVSA